MKNIFKKNDIMKKMVGIENIYDIWRGGGVNFNL